MASRLPLSQRPETEIRAMAEDYRRMAETASTMQVMAGLRRLADRLDAMLAAQRGAQGAPPPPSAE
jgi:hypothetical protein